VSSRKAGKRAKCPKCQQTLTIPALEEQTKASDAADSADQPGGDSADGGDEIDPFAQFTVYDDEHELVYASDEDEGERRAASIPVDATKVAVSRRILYMQGALLGMVAIFCFVLGLVAGAGLSGNSGSSETGPKPCSITGRVAYGPVGDEPTPDVGAVAIVVPQEVRPEEKAGIEGLRPQDPPPDGDHPGLQAIRNIGGDYTRVDEDGNFQLRVSDIGRYFVLVISANRNQPAGEQAKAELAQIGRFFELTPDLFGGNDYRWQEETVKNDREINFVFP
jgi:hypothetical protein